MRGTFERKSTSASQLVKVKAYAELHKLIEKYKKEIITLEKNRLYKEKTFYTNEDNKVKADLAAKKLDTTDSDVSDNLNKMAIHILKPDMSEFKKQTEGSIDERVTQVNAEQYLAYWKELKVKANIHG